MLSIQRRNNVAERCIAHAMMFLCFVLLEDQSLHLDSFLKETDKHGRQNH